VTLAAPGSARAEMMGHVAVGYAKLFQENAPGGSLSIAGGLDWPMLSRFRIGFGVGYSLLGSSTEQRGSLFANLDYSALEAYAVGSWRPPSAGPVERVSLGLGVMNALAEISAAGGGAAFRDLAREGIVPAVMIETTLMSTKPAPVRTGLEMGARFGFLEEEVWPIATVRVAFHY
jgi:hypothetical protein